MLADDLGLESVSRFSQVLIVGGYKNLLALPHSFVVNVKSLLTLEMLALSMERNRVHPHS